MGVQGFLFVFIYKREMKYNTTEYIMVILFITLLLTVINLPVVVAQPAWEWVNPLPQGNYLQAVNVFDYRIAIAVGATGTVMRTENGGRDWRVEHRLKGMTTAFNNLFFIDDSIGWIVGGEGVILKTRDGGNDWMVLNSGTDLWLTSVYFVNRDAGWIVG